MTVFEQHPKITLAGLLLVSFSLVIWGLEWSAREFFGLGNVVVYEAHPLYGYRPLANQTVERKKGQVVHINNLGLRANENWVLSETKNKVLFLGDSVTYGGSYIDNHDLFSTVAITPFSHFSAGNAGVNGWGVSNVKAFIMETGFLPTDIYVSVFPEGDFYRGINRLGGQPFWTVQPRFALEELFQYFIYSLHLKKTPSSINDLNENQKIQVVESAVKDLKVLDDYLKANGKIHLIYITPTRAQIVENAPKDERIKSLLDQYHVNAIYIADKLPSFSTCEKSLWFHDNIHLSKTGHYQWAKIISNDLTKYITNQEKVSS